MKPSDKIKLTQLHREELSKKELNKLLGKGTPGCCVCGCFGPSGSFANSGANNKDGLHSPSGGGGDFSKGSPPTPSPPPGPAGS